METPAPAHSLEPQSAQSPQGPGLTPGSGRDPTPGQRAEDALACCVPPPVPLGSPCLSHGPIMLTCLLEADGLTEGQDGWVVGLETLLSKL